MLVELMLDEDSYESPPVRENIRTGRRRKPQKPYSSREERFIPREGIPIDENETEQCKSLWRAVVIQALYDLSGSAGTIEKKIRRANSYAWFSELPHDGGMNDFSMVCDLAGIDRKKLLRAVRLMREEGVEIDEELNFKTIRKEFQMRRRN